MSGTDPGLQQLARALELVQAHRRRPLSSDETLLAAHPELRELLEALLEEQPADGAHESPAAPDEPRVLGDFRLLRELGRGGMGVVYEALQLSLHRRVALKVLAGNRLASPTALVRFRREAELLAQLQHDHLVPVFASGEADGEHFFAMERVDGCSLATVLREFSGTASATLDGDSLAGALRSVLDDPSAGARLAKRSHAEAALSCVLPIAEALAHAHAHGVVHRDVKPANILLRRDGTPLLGDFGLARNLDTPGLTLTGDFAGTPHYVAPEQVESKSGGVDHRVDVFSLGTTLYELLTLHRAFDGPSTQAVLAQVLRAEPTAPRRHGVVLPDDLLAVLDHALEKAPDERYQTMAEFAADLRAVLSLRPVSVRRPGPATRLRRFVRREPLRAALVLLLAIGVPALLSLSVYLWVQQPRIAAAAASETRQRVEELLEDAFLELGEGDPRRTLERATAARALLPDLPECTVALVLAHESLGDPTAQTLREELRQSQPELYRELLGAHSDTVTATEKLTPQPPLLPQATTATPVSALGYYVRGMRWLHFAHDSGDHAAYEHAAESLRQAVFRAPTARALYHCQYLHALFHLGDAPATEAFADVVAAAWPDSPVVWYWIGFALEDSRPERALRLQQRVVEARPDLVLPLASIARIHERAQHDEQAVACYRRMLTIRADDPSALIGLARTLVQVGRAAEALTVAERAVTVAPVSHMAHLAKAAALLALDQPVPARASAERALELVSVNPECHLLLANILLALDDPDGALAATERAAALDPADSEPYVVATLAHTARGDAAAAAHSLEQVVQRQPGRAMAWVDLAFRRLELDDAAGSEQALQAALQHGDGDPEVHLWAGNWCRRRGDADGAERHFLRAIDLDRDCGPALVNLAAHRWRQDRMDECIDLYRRATVARPELASASEGLALALSRQGRQDEAIAERRRWAEAHPDSVVDALRLVTSLLRRGTGEDVAAALSAVDRAEQAAGGPRADVSFWRAEALRQRGDAAVALRELYRQARALPDADDELRSMIDARLQALPK